MVNGKIPEKVGITHRKNKSPTVLLLPYQKTGKIPRKLVYHEIEL